MALNPFYLKIWFELKATRHNWNLMKSIQDKKNALERSVEKHQLTWSLNIVLKIDWSIIELDFYTFEYYLRVNSLKVVSPCFSWFLLSDESPSYSLDNQISKNQFQELKSCLFGFHHGQITEENHVLFLSTKSLKQLPRLLCRNA